MNSIGVELKNARIRKGLSLEEVSGITRIPIRLLQAIESDDLGYIDSAFFYRSFATQYAQSVGMDPSSLADALGAAGQHFPEPLVPGQEGSRVRPDLPGLKPRRTHKLKWVLSVGSLVVMLGACSTLYKFWEGSRTVSSAPARSVVSSKQSEPKSSKPEGLGLAPTDRLRIELSALENTWLSLTADGQEVFKGTLRADESKTLEGRLTAQVRTGNAGGVEVTFNGKLLGKLGAEGQIRTVVFTKDSYSVLHAQAPMPLASLIRGAE